MFEIGQKITYRYEDFDGSGEVDGTVVEINHENHEVIMKGDDGIVYTLPDFLDVRLQK